MLLSCAAAVVAQVYVKTRCFSYIRVEHNDNLPRLALHTGRSVQELERANPGQLQVGDVLKYPDTRSIVQEPDVVRRVVKSAARRSSACQGSQTTHPVSIVYTGKGWVWPFVGLDPATLGRGLYVDQVLECEIFQLDTLECDVVRAPFTGIVTIEQLPRVGQVVRLSALRGQMSVVFGCFGELSAPVGSIVAKGSGIVTWGSCGARRRLLLQVYHGKKRMHLSYLKSRCAK